MNRSTRTSLLLAIGALALSSAAFAQDHSMHAMMDADGDGAISAAEHAAGAAKMFAKADANGDGSVSADEMKAMHAHMMGKMGTAGDRKACDCACCKADSDKPMAMPADHAGHDGHH